MKRLLLCFLLVSCGNLGGEKEIKIERLEGEQGDKGDVGQAGNDGAQGPKGEAGSSGVDGVGSTGATGSRGATGARGQAGDQGPQGESGTPGQDGERGASGPQGQAGMQGPRGEAGSPGQNGTSAWVEETEGGVVFHGGDGSTVEYPWPWKPQIITVCVRDHSYEEWEEDSGTSIEMLLKYFSERSYNKMIGPCPGNANQRQDPGQN